MDFKSRFDHRHMADSVMEEVNDMLAAAHSDCHFEEISEQEGYDDCLIFGLVKNGVPLYKLDNES